jgi:hypothetical protein
MKMCLPLLMVVNHPNELIVSEARLLISAFLNAWSAAANRWNVSADFEPADIA